MDTVLGKEELERSFILYYYIFFKVNVNQHKIFIKSL